KKLPSKKVQVTKWDEENKKNDYNSKLNSEIVSTTNIIKKLVGVVKENQKLRKLIFYTDSLLERDEKEDHRARYR
ncbi:11754_t:CDS:2, partial [Dentiscutata heterogama]